MPFRVRASGVLSLGLVCLCLAGACRRADPLPPRWDPAALDGRRAMEEVERFVRLGSKEAGSEGGRAAAGYLEERLRVLGAMSERMPFTVQTPEGPLAMCNVWGFVPGEGTNPVLLLAHFDTKTGVAPDFAGANDSGSGVGVLLELTRALTAAPRRPYPVILAFVDGEECRRAYGPADGLHGSRRWVEALRESGELNSLRAVIVLDMVGDRDLNIALPRNGTPWLMSEVLQASHDAGSRLAFRLSDHAILDDHQPFLEAGVPAVDLIDFQYGSAPGLNDYWHTPEDTLDKLSAESLQTVGRVTLHLLNRLAVRPVQPGAPAPRRP